LLQDTIDKISGEIEALADEAKKAKESSDEWFLEKEGLRSVILAGDVVIAGGDDVVLAASAGNGQQVWRHRIEGVAAGLAVSDGYLLISSDRGNIYYFGREPAPKPGVIKNKSSHRLILMTQKACYTKSRREKFRIRFR